MTEVPGLQIQKMKGCVWVTLPKDVNMKNEQQIQSRIESELTGKPGKVVLDLKNNDKIYSVTIGIIMHLRMRIVESGGSLFLANVSPNCLNKLQQLQLNKVLKNYENEEELSTGSWQFDIVPIYFYCVCDDDGVLLPKSERERCNAFPVLFLTLPSNFCNSP